MLARARRFLREYGDDETRRVYVLAVSGGLAILLFLGLLKGEISGAAGVSLVLVVAVGVLYVLFCVSNKVFAGRDITAADIETVQRALGQTSCASTAYDSQLTR